MKKFILLLVGITIISCSKDNTETNGTDPIIATWLSTQEGADIIEEGDEDIGDINLTFNFTLVFNSNGTLSQEIEFTSTDSLIQSLLSELNEEEGGVSMGSWENSSNSPNFSNTRQTYSITTEGETENISLTFNSSFTEFSLSEDGETLTFTKQ